MQQLRASVRAAANVTALPDGRTGKVGAGENQQPGHVPEPPAALSGHHPGIRQLRWFQRNLRDGQTENCLKILGPDSQGERSVLQG